MANSPFFPFRPRVLVQPCKDRLRCSNERFGERLQNTLLING